MNIDMRVCHFYVRAAELPRDVFQHIVVYVPVVAARRPETECVADRAVAIAGEAGEDGLKIHTLGVLRSADKRFFDRIRRCVIAGLHDDFNAPEGVSGDVCDLRGGDLAVRNSSTPAQMSARNAGSSPKAAKNCPKLLSLPG